MHRAAAAALFLAASQALGFRLAAGESAEPSEIAVSKLEPQVAAKYGPASGVSVSAGLFLATALLLSFLAADRQRRRQRRRQVQQQQQQQPSRLLVDNQEATQCPQELPKIQSDPDLQLRHRRSESHDSSAASQGAAVRSLLVQEPQAAAGLPASPFSSLMSCPFTDAIASEERQTNEQQEEGTVRGEGGGSHLGGPAATTHKRCPALGRRSPQHLSTALHLLPFLQPTAPEPAGTRHAEVPLGGASGSSNSVSGGGSDTGTGWSPGDGRANSTAQPPSDRPPPQPAAAVASWDQLRQELSSILSTPLLEDLLPRLQSQAAQQQAAQAYGSGRSSPQRSCLDTPQLTDWEVSPTQLEICRRPDGSLWQLGSGGFGRVYKAMRFGVQPVAVKVLASAAEAQYRGVEEFSREMDLLRACKDPNIVSFLGASLSPDFTLLVLEFCEGGALNANLRAGRITWRKRGKQISLDVARGLAYLHGRRLVHLDLKSANILLDRHGNAKIADLGLARIIRQELSAVTANIGTLDWAAPEVLLGQRCTEKADIYSFGVCLWEICTREVPVRGRMRALEVPDDCPAEVATLVADCMSPDPAARPSAQQLVERLLAAPAALPAADVPAAAAAASASAPTAAVLLAASLPSQLTAPPAPSALQPLRLPSRPPRVGSLPVLPAVSTTRMQSPFLSAAEMAAEGQRPATARARGQQQQDGGIAQRPASSQLLPDKAAPAQARRVHELGAAAAAGQDMVRAASMPSMELHPGDVYGLGMF